MFNGFIEFINGRTLQLKWKIQKEIIVMSI